MMSIDDYVICSVSEVGRREHGEVEVYTKEERNERSKQNGILVRMRMRQVETEKVDEFKNL